MNELPVHMATNAFKQDKELIITSLPPTEDALFHHCLRVSQQVQIWLQALDAYINYPDVETSGFEMDNGCLQVKRVSKAPISKDLQLSSCTKHKGQYTQCVCITNKMLCSIYWRCPKNCPNRKVVHTSINDSRSIKASV